MSSTPNLIVSGVKLYGLKANYSADNQAVQIWNTDAVLVAEIPQFGEDFDTDSQGPVQTLVADKVIEVLNTRAAEEARLAEPGGYFCVIQEGGSCCEIYLHVSDNEVDANEFRIDCANDGAYRTSGVIEGPEALKRLSEEDRGAIFAWVDDLIAATKTIDLAEDV